MEPDFYDSIRQFVNGYLARGSLPEPVVSVLRFLDSLLGLGLTFVPTAEQVPALLEQLTSTDVMRQISAARSLGAITEQDPAVIAALHRAAVEDKNFHVRSAARDALEKIAPAELISVTASDKNLQAGSPLDGLSGVVARRDGTVVFEAGSFIGLLTIGLGVVGILVAVAFAVLLVMSLVNGDASLLENFRSNWLGTLIFLVGIVGGGIFGIFELIVGVGELAEPDLELDPPKQRVRLRGRFGSVDEYTFDRIIEIRVHPAKDRYDKNRVSVALVLPEETPHILAVVDKYQGIPFVEWLAKTVNKPVVGRPTMPD